jgi:hypothetical protein
MNERLYRRLVLYVAVLAALAVIHAVRRRGDQQPFPEYRGGTLGADASFRQAPAEGELVHEGKGHLARIDGYRVLHVAGMPEQMGEQHGRMLRDEIRKACKALITDAYIGGSYERLISGTKVMEQHQPDSFRREMKALAKAAGIDYWDCVAMQLFGDVDRGQQASDTYELPLDEYDRPTSRPAGSAPRCSSYAVFGPATRIGELIAGRNLDFFDNGVGEYGAILMHARPDDGHAFLTVTWAGIINGWTLMNEHGIVSSNNTAYAGTNSLEGISTCFLLRHVAQNAKTVDAGIDLVKKGPRACGTNMLIAGGSPSDAVMVEFDHERVTVRRAERGIVLATNHCLRLSAERPAGGTCIDPRDHFGRYGTLLKLILDNHGRIDRSMNFAQAEGVPMGEANLHSALLFPKDRIIRVSMGKAPAYRHRYRGFRMTKAGVVKE